MYRSLIASVLGALCVVPALFATETWDEEDIPSTFDLFATTNATLPKALGGTRNEFFLAGQGGIWRGDQARSADWNLIHNEPGAVYRAMVAVPGIVRSVQAVGDAGKVVSSLDGEVWTPGTVAGNPDFTGLAVDPRLLLFVAVDSAGQIYSGGSVAGLSVRNPGLGIPLRSVTFGANLFVAVGDDATVAISTDGNTWQFFRNVLTDGLPTVDFHDVHYGQDTYQGGFFTAVGADGFISTSTNGTNWRVRQSGKAYQHESVTFAPRHSAWIFMSGSGLGEICNDADTSFSVNNIDDRLFPGVHDVFNVNGTTIAVGDGGSVWVSETELHPSSTDLVNGVIQAPDTGGNFTVNLNNSSADAKWHAETIPSIQCPNPEDFVSIVSSFGTGNSPGSFTIQVDPFTTITNRCATVRLNDQIITVVQAGDGDPLPVTALDAVALTDKAIELSWPPVAGASHYEVQRRELSNVDFEVVGQVDNNPNAGGCQTFVDGRGPLPNLTYCYQVIALNLVLEQHAQNPPLWIACNTPPCNGGGFSPLFFLVEYGRAQTPSPLACATTLLTGSTGFRGEVLSDSNGLPEAIELTWTPVAGAESYTIDQNFLGTFSQIATVLPPDLSLLLTPPGFDFGQGFVYQLRAVTGGIPGVPRQTTVLTTTNPPLASVVAVDIPDVGPLVGAYDLTIEYFGLPVGQTINVQTRVEPGGPWITIHPDTTTALTRTSLDVVLDKRIEVWRYSQPAVTRSFRVQTRVPGFSPPSAWVDLGPVSTPPPGNPTGLSLVSRSSTEAEFSWSDSPDEERYELNLSPLGAVDDSQDIRTGLPRGSTSVTVPGLLADTDYVAELVAIGREGIGTLSRSLAGGSTLGFASLPSGPATATAIVQGPTFISVTWDEVPGATSYEVWRSDFIAGGFQPYAFLSVGSISTRHISDFSVTGSNSYRYQVRAVVDGDFTPFTESNIASTPMGAPTITQAQQLGSSSILLQWTDPNPSEVGFTIERALAAGGPWATVGVVNGSLLVPPPLTFTDTGLAAAVTYHYRVSARGIFGAVSPPSASLSATTEPELQITGVTTNSITLNWDLSGGIANYLVTRSDTGAGGTFNLAGSVPHPTDNFTDTGRTPSTVYHYRMFPEFPGGAFGAITEIKEAVTKPLAPPTPFVSLIGFGPPGAFVSWLAGSISDEYHIQWHPPGGSFTTIGVNPTEDGFPPLRSFSHSGIAPGLNSYRVQAFFMGQASTYSPVVTLNYSASLAEQWRYDNFGTIHSSGDAADSADPDGDGFTNAEERVGCTDPNDSGDFPTAPLLGSITYLDATDGPAGNTTFADGSPFTATTVPSTSDGLWTKLALGINGTHFETNGTGPAGGEDAPPLRTTIEGLKSGRDYDCFAYFWSDVSANWRLKASVTTAPPFLSNDGLAFSRSGNPSSADAPAVPIGVDGSDNLGVCYTGFGDLGSANASWNSSDLYFDASIRIGEGNLSLYQADLGPATAGPGGEIAVYIDDFALAAPFTRTAFEGVGFRLVPADLRVTHVAFDPLTNTVTLRWPDNEVAYEVMSSTNLLFGDGGDTVRSVIGANGLIDTGSFPGEIQFEFVDPDATGLEHFWQVREQ